MANTAPAYSDFQAQFPQLASSPLGEIQLALSIKLLDPSVWDDFYSDAVILDCAHNLEILNISGKVAGASINAAAGPISSASGAGLSTGFNSLGPDGKNPNRDWYNKTAYGQMLLRIWGAVIPIGFLA